MLKCFKDEKFWCAVGGAAAVILGKKVVKAKKTRTNRCTQGAFLHDTVSAGCTGRRLVFPCAVQILSRRRGQKNLEIGRASCRERVCKQV